MAYEGRGRTLTKIAGRGTLKAHFKGLDISDVLARILKARVRKRPSRAARACASEGPRLVRLRERITRRLLIGRRTLPNMVALEGSHARAGVHALIGPERPAHLVALEREPEAPHPFICVLAGTRRERSGHCTCPRIRRCCAKALIGRLCPVGVESVDELVCKARLPENF